MTRLTMNTWKCELQIFGGLGPYDGNGPYNNHTEWMKPEVVPDRMREAFERAVSRPQHTNAILSQFQTKPQPQPERQPRAIIKKSTAQPEVASTRKPIGSSLNPEVAPFITRHPSTGSTEEEVLVSRPFCSSLPSVLRCSAQENGHKERLMMRMRMANFIRAVDEGKVDLDAFVIPPEEKAVFAEPQRLCRGPREPHRPFPNPFGPFRSFRSQLNSCNLI